MMCMMYAYSTCKLMKIIILSYFSQIYKLIAIKNKFNSIPIN